MSSLQLSSINHQYTNTKKILNNVSLTIKPGEIHLIYGRSGSGKSTLLNCIVGVELIDSGQIYVQDTLISSLSENQYAKFRLHHIGILYQFFNLLPALTLKENILLPARIAKKYDDLVMKDIVDTVGISDVLDQYPELCSGGECQRAALCRALICRPKLILADEPTGNLDTQSRDKVCYLLRKIATEDRVGILIATHDHDLKKIADYSWSLADGHFIQTNDIVT